MALSCHNCKLDVVKYRGAWWHVISHEKGIYTMTVEIPKDNVICKEPVLK